MKKYFQIIGVLILIWFSFFCTEKTATVIKNTDEIMIKINDEKEKYNTKYTDSIIVKDTIIPGISGLVVNEDESYLKMKRLGRYNPSLYVYNKEKPSISIKDNYDKYIIRGNPKKRIISLIFSGDIEQIKMVHQVLKSSLVSASYYLKDSDNYSELSKYIDDDFDLVIDSQINYKIKKATIYCYSSEKEEALLKYCESNKYFSIQPTIIIENELYTKIKQSLKPGLIVLININDNTVSELPSVINYLKSKGYEMSNLTTLIEE